MNVSSLIEQLAALEKRYQVWVKPINQVIQECSYKVNRNSYTLADFQRDVDKIRAKQQATADLYQEMYALLDELCPAYLEATPAEREKIRAAASDKDGLLSALLGYVYKSARQIRCPADREWLRRGLAAVSIENCRKDYRDVLLALAELYVLAEAAGLNPKPDFRAIAKISSRQSPTGGSTSVANMLANFHTYGALKERRAQQTGREFADGARL
ncbi:MAG: hypothetical protein JW953_20070 [Anaerolineae bacterium]|nr:hypothetical protein [Anaerolineae bacterium]